jgi:hypothetical protein
MGAGGTIRITSEVWAEVKYPGSRAGAATGWPQVTTVENRTMSKTQEKCRMGNLSLKLTRHA